MCIFENFWNFLTSQFKPFVFIAYLSQNIAIVRDNAYTKSIRIFLGRYEK